MIDKIKALLAKAEGTTNPHERDSFNAKAEELMLRHGVEQAELESRGEVKPEEIVQETLAYRGSYSEVMGNFANAVCIALGHLTVLQTPPFRGTRYVYIIGHETDVENAVLLVRSLETQAIKAAKAWARQGYGGYSPVTGWDKYQCRRTYVRSFATGAGDRIQREREVREGGASAGAELVLVSKQQRVDSWVAETYTKLGKSRGLSTGYGARDGYAAGQKADIGTDRLTGARKEVSR